MLTNRKNPISRQPMSYDQTPQIEPILEAVTKRAVLQGHLRAKGAGVLDGALGIDLRWGAPLDPPECGAGHSPAGGAGQAED